jgi:predicted 3-demethylubiquinone-9 3-methyltransferase (glyoxalase superfamily)
MAGIGARKKDVDRCRNVWPNIVLWSETLKEDAMQKIHPFLWFDSQAEEAMNLYVSIFPNSKVGSVQRYGDAGPGPKGSVMTADFELDGQRITALNGGPVFKFTEAVSFVIDCADQAEVDHYWDKLSEGGETSQCGWLKDRYGLSWQVVPKALFETIGGPDAAGSKRAMEAMMKMTKLDVATLERAYRGEAA